MSAAANVYDHIAKNNLKTWLLVLLFPLALSILLILGCIAAVYINNDKEFTISGLMVFTVLLPQLASTINENTRMIYAGIGHSLYIIPIIFIISFIWITIVYYTGDKMMLSFAQAEPLDKSQNRTVYQAVENVAIMAGLPTPKVYIIEDESLNAFATGRSPEYASIALTTGIIKKLEPLELEAVIAHEMAHIGNRDIRLDMMIIAGIGIFGFLSQNMRFSNNISRGSDKKNGQAVILMLMVMLALIIFSYLIAPLIRMAISRTREYAADATGALITRNPLALASALEKISADARVEVLDKQKSMAVACIFDPTAKMEAKNFAGLSATHPPVQYRIHRLKSMVR